MPGVLYHPSEKGRAGLPAWLYVALGSLALGYVGWVYLQQQEFLARAICVQGTVVGNWHTQRKGADYYTVIFTFTDGGGQTRRVFDREHRHRRTPAQVGTPCPVVYNPDDPARAEIEASDPLGDVLARTRVAWFLGVPLLIRGLWGLGRAWLARRRQRPPGNGGVPRDPAILSGPR